MATSYLSHFLLTNLLMPKILAAGSNARIINVSSWVTSPPTFATQILTSTAERTTPRSKHTSSPRQEHYTLRWVESNTEGKGIKSFALHPGSILSNLQKYVTPENMQEAVVLWKDLGMELPERKTVKQGYSTTLRAALDPSLGTEGSVFLTGCQLTTEPLQVRAYSLDKENMLRCWALSEEMVAQKFEY